tara:strand:+ start:68 stop:313 length:246 start_codon:yes stop_codon:yes gene_type:complete
MCKKLVLFRASNQKDSTLNYVSAFSPHFKSNTYLTEAYPINYFKVIPLKINIRLKMKILKQLKKLVDKIPSKKTFIVLYFY